MRTWLGMKPEGAVENEVAPVDMLGPVSMRFRPVLPTDQQALWMIALQLVNAPKQLLSRETALKDFGQLEDPQGEIDKIAVEEAMNDPSLKLQWIAAALDRAGIKPPPPPILGPNGQPLQTSGAPGIDGAVSSGTPSVPGLNMPMNGQQAAAHEPGGQMPHEGGRVAGSFPGQPGGVNR